MPSWASASTAATAAISSASGVSKDLNSYEIGPSLGKGSYAVVRLATDNSSKRQVAIKMYEKKKLADPHKLKNVRREVSILSKLSHANIVKLYTVIDSPDTV
jgi:MAP/microtubule affinity-regulating kinase